MLARTRKDNLELTSFIVICVDGIQNAGNLVYIKMVPIESFGDVDWLIIIFISLTSLVVDLVSNLYLETRR